jgi:MtN3 and saliva related transmembrane protein
MAGSLTTFSYLPQLIKAIKTKSTKDLSTHWLYALTIGLFFWIAYGYLISSIPVVLFNVILAFITIWLLVLKAKYK